MQGGLYIEVGVRWGSFRVSRMQAGERRVALLLSSSQRMAAAGDVGAAAPDLGAPGELTPRAHSIDADDRLTGEGCAAEVTREAFAALEMRAIRAEALALTARAEAASASTRADAALEEIRRIRLLLGEQESESRPPSFPQRHELPTELMFRSVRSSRRGVRH